MAKGFTFYEWMEDNTDRFDFGNSDKEISVQVIYEDVFVRVEDGCESVQIVFTKDEFAQFAGRCMQIKNQNP